MVAVIPGVTANYLFSLNFFEKTYSICVSTSTKRKAQESLVSHPADYAEVAGQRVVNDG